MQQKEEKVEQLVVHVEVEDMAHPCLAESHLAPVFHLEYTGYPVYQYQLYSLNSLGCDSPALHHPPLRKPFQHSIHFLELLTMKILDIWL